MYEPRTPEGKFAYEAFDVIIDTLGIFWGSVQEEINNKPVLKPFFKMFMKQVRKGHEDLTLELVRMHKDEIISLAGSYEDSRRVLRQLMDIALKHSCNLQPGDIPRGKLPWPPQINLN